MGWEKARTFGKGLATKLIAGIGGSIAVLASTGYAVVGAMPPAKPPVIGIGQPVQAGRWKIVPLRAYVGLPPHAPGGFPGKSSLIVEMEMTNLTAETSNLFAKAVKLDPPIAGLVAAPTFYLVRDGALLDAIQPGLPEKVAVAWEIQAQPSLPPAIQLSVTAETFKPRDNLYAMPGWFNPKVVASLSLPVTAQ
jgi:hypothetical protein